MSRVRAGAERVGVRVLEQEQVVLLTLVMQRALEVGRLVVRDAPEPTDVQRPLGSNRSCLPLLALRAGPLGPRSGIA